MLSKLSNAETNIEYTKLVNWRIKIITKEEAWLNKTKDIYFLPGIRTDLEYTGYNRAKDEDIAFKNYFVIDLDIRKNSKELKWIEIDDQEIIDFWLSLKEFLAEEESIFAQWSYIIFTWNGLHIYYINHIWDISKEDYANWVQEIYNMWNEFWGDEVLYADNACKNIARILRLPGSVNQKNGSLVKIIAEQDIKSELISNIKEYAWKVRMKKQLEEQRRKEEIEQKLKMSGSDNKFYETINEIRAYDIAQILVPDFPYDWKRNFKNKKWWFTWYFYSTDNNAIVNWWSRFFNWGDSNSQWCNFALVKNFYWYNNNETFQWFKAILKHK
jgi:hypothetical protein